MKTFLQYIEESIDVPDKADYKIADKSQTFASYVLNVDGNPYVVNFKKNYNVWEVSFAAEGGAPKTKRDYKTGMQKFEGANAPRVFAYVIRLVLDFMRTQGINKLEFEGASYSHTKLYNKFVGKGLHDHGYIFMVQKEPSQYTGDVVFTITKMKTLPMDKE